MPFPSPSPRILKAPLILLVLAAGSLARAIAAVTITDAEHEGRPQFKIVTAGATWFYDKAGGGFSRLLDRDGRDWIAFKKEPLKETPASAAAGYRGIPNLVFGRDNPDAGAGHPGFDLCVSHLAGADTIRTASKSGRWQWSWRFTGEHAMLTVERADPERPYWFLYEGPVGGRWSPRTHYFGADTGGPRRDQPHNRAQHYERWRWAYFGDDAAPRVLLATQSGADALDDTLWYMGSTAAGLGAPDGMVVFGFGRGKNGPQFRGPGRRFTVGFVEGKVADASAHARVADVAQRRMADAPLVRVSEAMLFGDMDCFRIETPHATYLFGKTGAGFASILDRDGKDWISYRHGNRSAGEFRGLPKCGQPVKYFHCGYGFGPYRNDNPFVSVATVLAPDHVRIRSETRNGDAAGTWDFFATHATFTLEKIPGGYWFLYEGTPGGAVDAGDFVVRPRGHVTPIGRPWEEEVPWMAFGASESPHVMLLISHQAATEGASHVTWPYTPNARETSPLMTASGFGRPAWDNPAQHTPPLTRLPAKFTIAFAERADGAVLDTLAEEFRK